jgi:hypothetical protein
MKKKENCLVGFEVLTAVAERNFVSQKIEFLKNRLVSEFRPTSFSPK